MTNFESKNILSEDIENTAGKENKKEEYKSKSTGWHEQEAEKAKEEIKELNEKSKKLINASEKLIEASKKFIEASEEKKKEPDDSSI